MRLYLKKSKKFLKKCLVGGGLFLASILMLFFYDFLTDRFPHAEWLQHPVFFLFSITFVSVVIYKPLDIGIAYIFKNLLFRKKSYRHTALQNLAEELVLILDLQELGNLIVNTLGEVLSLKTVAFIVPSREKPTFDIVSAFGWNVSDFRKVKLPDESPLVSMMLATGSNILTRIRSMRTCSWQDANRLAQDFDLIRANWVIPLFVEDELTGAIAFSALNPERVFDETDYLSFRELAGRVAKNVRNALVMQELKESNHLLRDSQSQILQATKLAAIEQLATGFAHEIHNPLTIISGKAQVLLMQKKKEPLPEKIEETLETIVKQTKRAADITRKLLMFSQGADAPKEQLHLEMILEETLSLVAYQTSMEGMEIRRMIPDDLPSYYGNIQELREVFFNLILHSVSSLGGRGTLEIKMEDLTEDGLVEIRILDSGPGMEEKDIERFFNPFVPRKHDGVGLGLFVAKQIVHRYGGSIRIESKTGEGTLFIVNLPYLASEGTIQSGEGQKLPLGLFTETNQVEAGHSESAAKEYL